MKDQRHQEFEIIAGAIALGEATDADRRKYREHLSSCPQCLASQGGEHEIARTAETVAGARESEIWEPQLRNVFVPRRRSASALVNFASGFAITALAFVIGTRFVGVSAPPAPVPQDSNVIAVHDVNPVRTAAGPRRMVVLHNVIQLARAPVNVPNPSHSGNPHNAIPNKPPQMVAVTVYPLTPPRRITSTPAPAQPDWRTVSRFTTTAISETAPQRYNSAENLQIEEPRRFITTRDAEPVGGDTAINPQPPMIAYAEGAQGTTAFEVMVDERGTPTKCVITKPAGYSFLDDAVCKAAMKAKFTPKTVNGNPVPGVYRDAFTFRVNDNVTDGLPRPIHF